MRKECEQSYYISQLVRLHLLAFRDDWREAFMYAGYSADDSYNYAYAVTKLGIIRFVHEYGMQSSSLDVELLDSTINYLVRKFKL